MGKGDRVVMVATGDRGVVTDSEHILGEPEDLWSEVQLSVLLDGMPEGFEVGISERAVVLETDYDNNEGDA